MTLSQIPTTRPVRAPVPAADRPAQDEMLEALFRDHAPGLRARLMRLTRDPAVADDLVGDAFLRLALELRAGRPPQDARAWLHRVGANLVVSRARRASVATRALPALLDRSLAGSPEDEVVRRERDMVLHDGLDTLSGDDRRIVVLAARGYGAQEIAAIIGCSQAATRTRLCRARGRLRARLELVGLTA